MWWNPVVVIPCSLVVIVFSMISFKHIVHYYYYRLKRQHSSSQVVYIMVFKHYNIFMISLTYIFLYYRFSTEKRTYFKPSGPLLNFLKRTTWFKSSIRYLNILLAQYFTSSSWYILSIIINILEKNNEQSSHYWVFSKKDDMVKTK